MGLTARELGLVHEKKNQSRLRIPTGLPTGRLRNKLVNYDTRWRTIEGRIRGKELIALVPHFTMAMLHKMDPRMYRELVAEGNKRWLPESQGGGYISQPALRQAHRGLLGAVDEFLASTLAGTGSASRIRLASPASPCAFPNHARPPHHRLHEGRG